MNRIQPLPESLESAAQGLSHKIGSALFTPAQRDTDCALFVPLHYERNYAYPLIVWLHGPGADESQLKRIMPLVSTRNYVAVAPRGLELPPSSTGRTRYGWPQSDDDVAQAELRIFDAIERARCKLNIAPGRIFLAGFDTGGTMAYRVAMNEPCLFAGVLSLGGAFPSGGRPLSRLTECRRLPLFVASGRDSADYPAQQVCDDLRLFHTAGMAVTLRLYPCGHQIAPDMLADMDRWIMEQIAAPPEGADASHGGS